MRGSHRQTCRPKCSIWALRHGRQRRLLKKICPIGRHLTNQGRGGGIFKKNIIYICIVVSSDKEGKWSFFIALVHARLGSARPCMRYFV